MPLLRRVLSPLGFALVAASFALPYVAARHEDALTRVAETWHGSDLTIGGKPRIHLAEMVFDGGTGQSVLIDRSEDLAPLVQPDALFIAGQPAFMIAIVAVVAGVLAEVLSGRRSRLVLAATAAMVAAGALVVGEWLVMRRLDTELGGPRGLQPVPAYGLWVALTLLVVLAVVNVVAATRVRTAGEPRLSPTPAEPGPQ